MSAPDYNIMKMSIKRTILRMTDVLRYVHKVKDTYVHHKERDNGTAQQNINDNLSKGVIFQHKCITMICVIYFPRRVIKGLKNSTQPKSILIFISQVRIDIELAETTPNEIKNTIYVFHSMRHPVTSKYTSYCGLRLRWYIFHAYTAKYSQ